MNRFSTVIFALLLVSLIFFMIFGNRGLLHLHDLTRKARQLEAKNRELESEIIALRSRIYSVQYDPFTLEQEARQQLGLSKPGEIVYIFSPNAGTGFNGAGFNDIGGQTARGRVSAEE